MMKEKPPCPFCLRQCRDGFTCNIPCKGIEQRPECEKELFCTISEDDFYDTCDQEKCEERIKAYLQREIKYALEDKLKAVNEFIRKIGD